MSIEEYIQLRKSGEDMKEIQQKNILTEQTVLALELGYQCHLKDMPLKNAISVIKNILVLSSNSFEKGNFNRDKKLLN